MTSTHDRIQTAMEFGFTERQARFLVLVIRHAGVCVPRQYARFAGVAYGAKCNAFFDRLVRRGFAHAIDCIHNCARLYHVHSKARTTSSATPGAGTAGRCHRASRSSG